MIWAIIIAGIVALDQSTKYFIARNIGYGEIIPVINGFFYLTYHENMGAAWGILQKGRVIFLIMTPVVFAVIVHYMLRHKNRFLWTALSFILGGAAGNFIDRAVKGRVADFLDFHIWGYHFPTFNAADTFITVGTILLAIYLLFIYKEPEKKGTL